MGEPVLGADEGMDFRLGIQFDVESFPVPSASPPRSAAWWA
jgi:hypothetical protein